MKFLLLLDYDGTLTPIVSHPKLATLSSQRKKRLRRVASSPRIKMCIISGRKLSEVKRLVGLPRVIYVGNHGFESRVRGRYLVHPAARKFTAALKKIKAVLKKKIRIKGVFVEDKRYTLSVHYRQAAEGAQALLRRSLSEALRPWEKKTRITRGKKVIEIRPPFRWDKGCAVKWLIKELKLRDHLPVYIGDDATDEDAFRALKGRGLGIKVGSSGKTSADLRVKGVTEVYNVLEELK